MIPIEYARTFANIARLAGSGASIDAVFGDTWHVHLAPNGTIRAHHTITSAHCGDFSDVDAFERAHRIIASGQAVPVASEYVCVKLPSTERDEWGIIVMVLPDNVPRPYIFCRENGELVALKLSDIHK